MLSSLVLFVEIINNKEVYKLLAMMFFVLQFLFDMLFMSYFMWSAELYMQLYLIFFVEKVNSLQIININDRHITGHLMASNDRHAPKAAFHAGHTIRIHWLCCRS